MLPAPVVRTRDGRKGDCESEKESGGSRGPAHPKGQTQSRLVLGRGAPKATVSGGHHSCGTFSRAPGGLRTQGTPQGTRVFLKAGVCHWEPSELLSCECQSCNNSVPRGQLQSSNLRGV